MRKRPAITFPVVFSLLSSLLALDGVARAEAPWTRPFASDAGAIARAAAQTKAESGTEAIVLFEEGHYYFEPDGRSTYTYRQVARVLRESAVDEWASWSVSWASWHEERPVLRGRVIAPNGRVREIDPATIEESARGGSSSNLYSDEKTLRAPLPGVSEGAVVEVEIVSKELAPLFDAGVVNRFYFGKGVPIERARLVVDAPKSLTLSFKQVGLDGLKPGRVEANGRVIWTFERGPIAAVEPMEEAAPPSWPKVMFATGASWAQVARSYARLVDQSIANGDVAALATEARAGATDRATIAARLLARLHKEVRYTGVELGEASIVPGAPSQTLTRQFGDCKDQATLLVALLRASGVPAHVALLKTGRGLDADPGLPGLDFDHAIVYLPGAPALWIDPTDRFARVGELPLGDQGRHALIAAATTTALTETPRPRAAQNVMIEERTFELAEEGGARVIEVTRASGDFERDYRSYQTELDPKKDREQLEKYVADTYNTAKLDKYEHSDPNDLSRPFELRLEASDSGRGYTEEDHAEVGVFPGALLRWLPDVFKEKPKDAQPRRSEFVLFRPVRVEYHFHLVPPPGYEATQLPEARRIPVGPFHIDVRFDKKADGRIEGLLSFETDKTTLTAKEADAVRDKVVELDGQDGIGVRFENTAEAHLQAGRTKEGVAELRRLLALHPKEALHAIRLARALLRAGLGDAARDVARRAVELEPRNAVAWLTLGQALEADLLGRSQERGWDQAGAEAALRKAKALDPKSLPTRIELAILLEHEPDGTRYSPRTRWKEAAAEYHAVLKDLGSHAAEENLLILLMRMGRTDEVKALAKTMTATRRSDGVVVSAVAMRDGAAAAWKEAQVRGAELKARGEILTVAAATLLQLRYYPEAAALAQHASEGGQNLVQASQAQQLAGIRRRETVTLPDDPKSLVRRLFVAAAMGNDPAAVAPLLFEDQWPRGNEAEEGWFSVQKLLQSINLPAEVFADVWTSGSLEMAVDGDARWGWRVRIQAPLGPKSELYVVRTPAGLRLLAEESPARLAERALTALDRGDLEGARHWLDWMKQRGSSPGENAELQVIDEHSDRATLEAAAALAVVASPVAARALPYLDRCAAKEVATPRRLRCASARLLALVAARRQAEALTATEERIAEQPDEIFAHVMRAGLLADLGRKAESERAFTELRRRWPNDTRLDSLTAYLAMSQDQCADARRAYRRLIDANQLDALGRNNYAWCALVAGPVTDEDLAQARRAVEETGRNKPTELNTLAMLLAERGQLDAARDALRETILPGRSLHEEDQLVLGRMAEQLGLHDAAKRAYLLIPKPAVMSERGIWAIAQRRLAALEGHAQAR